MRARDEEESTRSQERRGHGQTVDVEAEWKDGGRGGGSGVERLIALKSAFLKFGGDQVATRWL